MSFIQAVNIFFPPLVTYGETLRDNAAPEGESQERMGRMLSFFQDACGFVNRYAYIIMASVFTDFLLHSVYAAVRNILQQLGALYVPSKANKVKLDMQGVHQQLVFEKLADALGILLTMDTIINSNEHLLDDWQRYGSMMSLIRADPLRVGLDGMPQFFMLEKMLLTFAGTLLEGNIFNACLSQQFDVDRLVSVTRNIALAAEMDVNIRGYFAALGARVGESNEIDQRQRFIGFMGLYAMFTRFYAPNVDKKLFKQIFMTVKKIPIVHLYGNVSFRFERFFDEQLRAGVQQAGLKTVELRQAVVDRVKRSDDNMAAYAKLICFHFMLCF